MKTFRTYSIQGKTAYAKGEKGNSVANSTIYALLSRGVHEIVWKNGDFISF